MAVAVCETPGQRRCSRRWALNFSLHSSAGILCVMLHICDPPLPRIYNAPGLHVGASTPRCSLPPSLSPVRAPRSVVPGVLPAQQGRAVLLRTVHQLHLLARRGRSELSSVTYKEPHGGAEAGGHESVQRADGVDLDGVVRHLCVLGRTHPAECGLHGCGWACGLSAGSWRVVGGQAARTGGG